MRPVLQQFYYAARTELEPWRPVGKFACVKAVVFLTWWQAVGIAVLQALGIIDDISEEYTKDVIGQGLQVMQWSQVFSASARLLPNLLAPSL